MKALHLLAAAAIALVVASCSSKPKVSYLPAKAVDDKNWGLVDADGEFLFTDEFSNRPSPEVNGFFFVEEGKGYTVYRAEKNPQQVGDLTGLKDCGFYNEGVMPIVRKGEHITFVDKNGETKFTLDQVNGVNVTSAFSIFINGRCCFETADNLWGAVDPDGNVVIEPKYLDGFAFIDDVAIVTEPDSDNAVIIDRDGNVKATLEEDMNIVDGLFIDGYAVAEKNDGDERRFYMIKKNGETVKLPSSVSRVRMWTDKYIIYRNDEDNYGIMTYDGDIKVRAKYDEIDILADGQFIAERDGKVMFLSPDDETQSLPKSTEPAIRYSYPFSKIYDFGFELISDSKGDGVVLRTYNGERKGKAMDNFKGRLRLDVVRSDYFDYADATAKFIAMFDSEGLNGYPFGSLMSRYVDKSRSTEWYRGDRSLGVEVDCAGNYFSSVSATLYSDRTIVYDSTPYASYYTWSYNPESRVDRVQVKVNFYYNTYREDLPEYFAKALKKKYGFDFSVLGQYDSESSNIDYVKGNGYDCITINFTGLDEAAEAPAVEECAADSCVAVCDTIAAEMPA